MKIIEIKERNQVLIQSLSEGREILIRYCIWKEIKRAFGEEKQIWLQSKTLRKSLGRSTNNKWNITVHVHLFEPGTGTGKKLNLEL